LQDVFYVIGAVPENFAYSAKHRWSYLLHQFLCCTAITMPSQARQLGKRILCPLTARAVDQFH
jgi:hypothetical protein